MLAVNREPLEMLNNVLSYVQLFLPVGLDLNLHPLALCSHLDRADAGGKRALLFCLMDGFQTGLGEKPRRACVVEPYK